MHFSNIFKGKAKVLDLTVSGEGETDSYVLVLAVAAVRILEPRSEALRSRLHLATLPEEAARLGRVGERVAGVDLAVKSLIQ